MITCKKLWLIINRYIGLCTCPWNGRLCCNLWQSWWCMMSSNIVYRRNGNRRRFIRYAASTVQFLPQELRQYETKRSSCLGAETLFEVSRHERGVNILYEQDWILSCIAVQGNIFPVLDHRRISLMGSIPSVMSLFETLSTQTSLLCGNHISVSILWQF